MYVLGIRSPHVVRLIDRVDLFLLLELHDLRELSYPGGHREGQVERRTRFCVRKYAGQMRYVSHAAGGEFDTGQTSPADGRQVYQMKQTVNVLTPSQIRDRNAKP